MSYQDDIAYCDEKLAEYQERVNEAQAKGDPDRTDPAARQGVVYWTKMKLARQAEHIKTGK